MLSKLKQKLKNSRLFEITTYCLPYKILYTKIIKRKINKLQYPYFDTLDIENTNGCNAQCKMCPIDSMTRKKGLMSFDNFKHIISQIISENLTIGTLHLSGFGEPFLDNTILEKIKYAKQECTQIKKVKIFSNLSLINESIAKEIVLSGLDEINISFNGFSNESIKEIMKLDFEKMKSNVLHLIKAKEQLKSATPYIELSFVEQPENQNEMSTFSEFWASYPLTVHIHKSMKYPDLNNNKQLHHKFNYPCPFLWNSCQITWDGNIKMCCRDTDALQVFGNVFKDSIKSIMSSAKINQFKNYHISNTGSKIDLCQKCEFLLKTNYIWWKQ